MHINKVVKYYFGFVLAVSSFAALNNNPALHDYMSSSYTSVLNSIENDASGSQIAMTNMFMPEMNTSGVKVRSELENLYVDNYGSKIKIPLKFSELIDIDSIKIDYLADYPNMIKSVKYEEKELLFSENVIEITKINKTQNLDLIIELNENLPVGSELSLLLMKSENLETSTGENASGVFPLKLAVIRVIAKQ